MPNNELKTLIAVGSAIACGLGLLWFSYRHFSRQKKLGKRATVKALYVYPIKSCAGIKFDKVDIEKVGVVLDRSWVLVNAKGIFQTMRQIPKMALIQPSFEGTNYLCLNAPGMPKFKLDINIDESKTEKRMLEIFGLHGEGLDCGDEVGKWFDEFLGKPGFRLFDGRSHSLKHRELKEDATWGDSVEKTDQMIYPDDGPVMMVSEGSLEAVNKELENPVDIRTFRPNIYIKGCSSYEEDTWASVQIGSVLLRRLRQNSRCILTTVDMDAGVKRKNGEPFKTLKRIRVCEEDDKRYYQKPLFGNLMVADIPGTISVGDDVIVLA